MIQLREKGIRYLAGSCQLNSKVREPFDTLVCDFLSTLGEQIKLDVNYKQYSDLATFAFWLREKNLKFLQKSFKPNKPRLGLGITFHITPGNVPINFAYSFVYSFLAGNANIVKCPSKNFKQIDIFCNAIQILLLKPKFQSLKDSMAFIKYDVCDEITSSFTKLADAKLVWGSDNTIKNVRALPAPPRVKDIYFSERFSICILDSNEVVQLDKSKLNQLCEKFYNDTYLMDQNACSSPSLVIWIGDNIETAKKIFWNNICALVERCYKIETSMVVDKYTKSCLDAVQMDGLSHHLRHNKYLYRQQLKNLTDCFYKGLCGYFYEYETNDLSSIAPVLNKECQTITYYGEYCKLVLNVITELGLQGVDRMVQVGKALDITPIWDGHDLFNELSRIIDNR